MKRFTWLFVWILIFCLAAFPVEVNANGVNPQKTSNPSGPAGLTFQSLWIYKTNNTTGINLVMDASGVLHAGFTAYSPISGKWPAYYATCTSSCASASGWSTVVVGDVGAFGGAARVAVNSAGHPSLMWFNQTSAGSYGSFYYAECSSSYGSGGTWTSVKLYTTGANPENSRYFTLNKNGSPRFVYKELRSSDPTHNNIYYAFCSAACTAGANWSHLLIDSTFLPYSFSLALDASGGAHLAFRDSSGSSPRLIYQECPVNCTTTPWNASIYFTIPTGSGISFALSLDPQGHPRLAFYSGYLGNGNVNNDLLYYLWCDSGCSGNGWDGYSFAFPAGYGETVDLAVDAQGYPRLAYSIDSIATSTYGLGYAACTANCDTSTPIWQDQLVETSDDLDASDPIPVAQGCTLSVWLEVGLYPSLVLDADGKPYIGYDASHDQGGSCSIHVDMNLVRIAASGNGLLPTKNRIYLPSVIKR
jgi:hypothetical protein